MSLESVTNIADLVRTNPAGGDAKSQGDDHLRNIKTALLNNIVGYPGAVTVTGTDGGTVNAYTLTPASGTLIAYGTRMLAVFSPTATNTGAVTLNISGLGAKNVLSVSGAALAANDLVVGNIYAAFYNGTEFRLLSITKNYADQLVFAAALPAQPGGTGHYELESLGGAAYWKLSDSIDRRAITTTDTVTVADAGNLIDVTSGTFALSFNAAATLGDKASGYIMNSGSGVVTLTPNGTETIDSLASRAMYPRELIRWYVEGGALRVLVLQSFAFTASANFTYIHPSGYLGADSDLQGAGGGGGGGARGAAGTDRFGGTAGGGGARVRNRIYGIAPGTSIAVSIGAGGTGGAGATVNDTAGANGTAGGDTSFGSYLTAYGGGAGRGASAANVSGGSGGGSASAGTSGASAVNGGEPSSNFFGSTTANAQDNLGTGGGASALIGGNAEYGGAGAGPSTVNANGQGGGSSIFAGSAGGSGGGIDAANVLRAGGAGGGGNYVVGSGPAGGAATGAAGTAGAAKLSGGGTGGGGGGSNGAGVGGAGGAGGPGAGGGGGGASVNGANGGAGGAGGAGSASFVGVA